MPYDYQERLPNYKIADLKQYAIEVAQARGIPSHYLLGLIEHESRWDPQAKNPRSSARGLGQHLDQTLRDLGYSPTNRKDDPRNDPYLSIILTAEHLMEKRARAPNWETAIQYYGENTSEYLQKVMKEVNRYQKNPKYPNQQGEETNFPQYLGPHLPQEEYEEMMRERRPGDPPIYLGPTLPDYLKETPAKPTGRRGEYVGPLSPQEYQDDFPVYLGPLPPGYEEEPITPAGDPALAFEMLGDMPNVGRAAGRIVQGVTTGVLSTVEGMTGFLDYMTSGRVGKDISKDISNFIRKTSIRSEDRRFADHLLSAAGSMATFLIPGIGVARGVQAIDKLSKLPLLASYLGIGTMSALEAATEAGSVYESAKELGQTKDEAEWAAAKTFWTNVPLLAITNRLGYFTSGRGLLRRVGLGGITEGTQEATQEVISGQALGGWSNIRPKDVLTAGAVGAIIGGGVGGIGGIQDVTPIETVAPPPAPPVTPTAPVTPTPPVPEVPAEIADIPTPPPEMPPTPPLRVVEPLPPEVIEQKIRDGERSFSELLRAIEEEDWVTAQEIVESTSRVLSPQAFDELTHPSLIRGHLEEDPFIGDRIPKLMRVYEKEILDPYRRRLGLKVSGAVKEEPFPYAREVPQPTFEPLYKLPDEIETAFQAASQFPEDNRTTLRRLRDFAARVKERAAEFYREYTPLPETPQFANLRSSLRRLKAGREFAQAKSIRDIKSIIEPLNPQERDLFKKAVVTRDFNHMYTQQGVTKFPFHYTPELLEKIGPGIEATLVEHPEVAEKLALRRQIWDSLRERFILSARKVGLNVEDRFQNPDYYRHLLLETAEEREQDYIKGPGKKWTQQIKGRSYMKHRVPHDLAISTRYVDAEYEAMSQMLADLSTLETLNEIQEQYDRVPEYKARARAKGEPNWEKEIEPGYVKWTPDPSSMFYHVYTIPEQAIIQATHDQTVEIFPDEISSAIAMGRQRTPLVFPVEVVETINTAFARPQIRGPVSRLAKDITRNWKKWILMSPLSLTGYNLRNLMGDLNALIVASPRALTYAPGACYDLLNWKREDLSSPDINQALKWGIIDSTLTTEELEETGEKQVLEKLAKILPDPTKPAKTSRLILELFRMPRKATVFRENILRLAAYKHVRSQWAQGNRILGFARRSEVEGITDPEAQVAYVARHMLGDYASISELGKEARQILLPFWSFQEINLGRWFRGLQNAVRGGRLEPTTKWHIGKVPIITASAVAPYFLKAMGIWALVTAWNRLKYPDEEDSLPEWQRARPHVIVGRNEDGSVRLFRGTDAFGEFVSWFGAEDWIPLAERVLQGQMTLKEGLQKAAKSAALTPAEKTYGMLTPFKSGIEIMGGFEMFPDPFSPRYTQDRWRQTAAIAGLRKEYDAFLSQRPGPSWTQRRDLPSAFALSRIDVQRSSYYDIRNLKNEFRERVLNKPPVTGTRISPVGQAYQNLIESTIYDDREGFMQALKTLADLDTSVEDIERAVERRDPLWGLNNKERILFVRWLSPTQRTKLKVADEWYRRIDIYKQIAKEIKARRKQRKSK